MITKTQTGTLASVVAGPTITVDDQDKITVAITGVFVGTITFQGSVDSGANWFTLGFSASDTGTVAGTTAAIGLWARADGTNLTSFRVNMTAFTSGTATWTFSAGRVGRGA